MSSILPTFRVELDDGTTTFPYDISSRVALTTGLTIQRGRSDELAQISPSTLSLTLENIDGAFSFGTAASAAAYPYGFYDQQIRVTIGGVSRFRGYITDVSTAWPDGSDLLATVSVTATDTLTRLARRQLRSITEQEILADVPYSLYMLSEGSGSLYVGDTSGHGNPGLFVDGTGDPVSFGGPSPNTWDGFSTCTFAGGQYIAGLVAPSPSAVEFVISRSGPPAALEQQVAFTNGIGVYVDTAGHVAVYNVATAALVCTSTIVVTDNLFHHVAVAVTGTDWDLYVDGISDGHGVGGAIAVGPGQTLYIGFGSTASIGAVAFWAIPPSVPRLAAHAAAVLHGFSERSDQRVARLAGYAQILGGAMALEVGSQTNVPAQGTRGVSVLDAMSVVATSEGGVLFIRGDGVLVFQNRTHRAAQISPAWTITHDDVGSDAAFSVDTQKLVNYITASSSITGAQQVVQDPVSIAAHEQYPTTLDLLVATDAEALAAAEGMLATYSEPLPRLPGVTIDLITQSDAVFRAAALALEISDRIRITGLPAQTPGGTTADLFVEGWTETFGASAWQMVLNTSGTTNAGSVVPSVGWVLDDTTYSVLGTTTVLATSAGPGVGWVLDDITYSVLGGTTGLT